jgi:uncharacterized repeat protein (TIGR03803 family)
MTVRSSVLSGPVDIRRWFPAAVALMLAWPLAGASAASLTPLYSFCSQTDCGDGYLPRAGLIFGSDGALYGTTAYGGTSGVNSTVFKLTPAATPPWNETVLYKFCQTANCSDGYLPVAGLIFGSDGALYGTTRFGGGSGGNGTVFKLTLAGAETVLYNFCSKSNCSDGSEPFAGLIFGSDGALYGTTFSGGTSGNGTVFKLTLAGTETVLYNFCSKANCRDGANPGAGLIFGSSGAPGAHLSVLYGTTSIGGTPSDGTVFKLLSAGAETVLYNFCSKSNCSDGSEPFAGLIFGSDGALYGTTALGGTHNQGTVFKLKPTGTETVLYNFGSQSNDGSGPEATLIFGSDGALYGTTFSGGTSGNGTVFKLTPAATPPWNETVLYSFTGGGDGRYPNGGLIFGSDGALYGTTRAPDAQLNPYPAAVK